MASPQIDFQLLHLEKRQVHSLDKSPYTLGGPGADVVLNEDVNGIQYQFFKRGTQWQVMALGRAELQVDGRVVDLASLNGGETLQLLQQLFQFSANVQESDKWDMVRFLDEFRKVVLAENQEEILSHLVRLISQVMDADFGLLHLEEQNKDWTWPTAGGVAHSHTLLDKALTSGEIVVWDASGQPELQSQSILRNKLSSVMVLPFVIEGANAGYLYVQRQERTEVFQKDDLALFKSATQLLQALVFNAKRKDELKEQLHELQGLQQKGSLLYADAAMTKLIQQVEKAAKLPVPVFIYGETGTGKEVLAQYLHQHSDRCDKPFQAINCGAIPENLIESELFGHAKGAFTGAVSDKKGLFEEANGGSIFLDEIGELPLSMQVKLLRVLQEKKVTPVGSRKEISVDFRLISATHVDLEKAISQGRFREDLLFRINLMTVEIPPLRERGQDVILLAQHFLNRFALEFGFKGIHFSRNAEKSLLRHAWSGNVRELINRVQKALIQCDGESIQPEDLGLSEDRIKPRKTLREAREAAEREAVEAALLEAQGNLTLAGSILGIDRKVLRELLERLGMDKNQFKGGETP